ncbi:hypothetical protein [Spiroplasma poulsonii]|uniref:hypothetical protein n=1 Tax=Spiroplasma poulsonii TaxID=2138 RepID=UPI001319FD2E|nr:hypothetical protein [Spiroplasma poulsonii]
MKKFFKEIDKLRLFFSCLSIIMCVLTTIFLILCREWKKKIIDFLRYPFLLKYYYKI